MDKINWCISTDNGIQLSEPSMDLAQAYLLKSEIAIHTVSEVSDKAWKMTAAYYSLYFSVYAVMARIGIRCEIHDCTIEFVKHFLKDYYSPEDVALIVAAKNMRIDAQYHVGRYIDEELYGRIIERIDSFCEESEETVKNITKADASRIRSALRLFACLK